MRSTFSVTGFGGRYGGAERILIVEEQETDRPVMMHAYGGMMDYLNKVGGTDVEEKYLDKIFVYDGNCTLLAILVPSEKEHIPAKAVILDSKDHTAKIFGNDELIDTRKPEPMPWEEWKKAWEFAMDAEDFNLRRYI